jgi:hypothetical protein
MDELAEFYVHTAVVETLLGTNGYGEDTFADPVTLDADAGNGCFLVDGRHLVRTADGEQVISESQLYTKPDNAALFTPNSRVTVNGLTSRVIRANLNTSGPLDLPDHVSVSLA